MTVGLIYLYVTDAKLDKSLFINSQICVFYFINYLKLDINKSLIDYRG